MGIFELLYIIPFLLISIVQFGLTIIGLVTVIKWIVNRVDRRKERFSSKSQQVLEGNESQQSQIIEHKKDIEKKVEIVTESSSTKDKKQYQEVSEPTKAVPSQIKTLGAKKTDLPPQIPNKAAKPKKSTNNKLTSADFLLYLGSFVFLGGVLVLVSFDWPLINGFIKTLILIFTMVAFLGSGSYLATNTKKFREVGKVLVVVGNLVVALSGLGFWNFGLSELWSGRYATYNLGYSLLILLVTFISLNIVNAKAYKHIFMLAIYNLFIGLATGLTAEFNYQVVLFAAINLIFRIVISSGSFVSEKVKEISVNYSIVINWGVDLAIIGLLAYNLLAGEVYLGFERFIILTALFIPVIHNLLGRRSYETGILHISLPIKFLLIGSLFNFNFLSYSVILLLLPIIFYLLTTVITKYQQSSSRKILGGLSFAFSNLILAIVSYSTAFILIFSDLIPRNLENFALLILVTILAFARILLIYIIPLAYLLPKKVISWAWSIEILYIPIILLGFLKFGFPAMTFEVIAIIILGLISIIIFGQYLIESARNSSNGNSTLLLVLSLVAVGLLVIVQDSVGGLFQGLYLLGISIVLTILKYFYRALSRLGKYRVFNVLFDFIALILQIFAIGIIERSIDIQGAEYLYIVGIVYYTLVTYFRIPNMKEVSSDKLIRVPWYSLCGLVIMLISQYNVLSSNAELLLILLISTAIWFVLFIKSRVVIFSIIGYFSFLAGVGFFIDILEEAIVDSEISRLVVYSIVFALTTFVISYISRVQKNLQRLVNYYIAVLTGFGIILLLINLSLATSSGSIWLEKSMSFILIGSAILSFKRRVFKEMGSFIMVLLLWSSLDLIRVEFTGLDLANSILYTFVYSFVLYVYLLMISVSRRIGGFMKIGANIELLAHVLFLFALTIYTIVATNSESVIFTIITIIISIFIFIRTLYLKFDVYGLSLKGIDHAQDKEDEGNQDIRRASILFITVAFLIRLIDVITVIPWWIYLLCIGTLLIAIAIYLVAKNKDS